MKPSTGLKTAASSWSLTAITLVGFLLMLAPFYWMIIATTHTTGEIFSNPPELLPGSSFWENVRGLFSDHNFAQNVLNSIAVSVSYTLLGGLICTLAGYAFAKFRFSGQKLIFSLVIASMAVPYQVTLVPLFQTMLSLGWLDSYQALVLPNLALPFGIFLMKQSMTAVPDELLQAGRIDGAGEFSVLFRIVLPTMRPSLAALGIFLFLAIWNDFMWPLVVLRNSIAYTVPVALASMVGLQSTNYGQLIAGTAVSVLPVAGLFLLLQRHFVAGMLSGAVKQ